MRPIIFNARARKDVFEIWEHIAVDSVDAADRMLARIESDIWKLAEMPGMGHRRADVRDPRLLFWSVRPYVIVYRHTRRTLYVVRVVHGARDFRRIFRK
jgi:plasmid stabilization system protein ParE